MENEIRVKELSSKILKLLDLLENYGYEYIRYAYKTNTPVYSDLIIFKEDALSILGIDDYKYLLENGIIRENMFNPKIVEIININKLIDMISLYREMKKYSLSKEILQSDRPFYELLPLVAPNVKNTDIVEVVKKVMLLQLFSGDDRGFRTRIHIALIGDPGTGKTLLLQWQSDVSGGLYISLRTTAAGLSGSLDPAHFYSSPPPLMVANGKILCIDEADKISSSDLDPLLTAMEEGKVILTGAGLHYEYEARVRVMLSSNRKRFRPELLDRFDLIALFRKPSKKETVDIIGHIIEYTNEENQKVLEESKNIINNYIKYVEKFYPRIVDNNAVRDAIAEIIEKTGDSNVRSTLRWLRFVYAYAKINRINITPEVVREVYDILKIQRTTFTKD
jgi:DNA replicative helicase MCM subunit Mcm2 (Cdc46/Mcm family)